MPSPIQDRVLLTCPHCGHRQPEPRTAFSTICKQCGQHLRVQEILHPPPAAPRAGPRQRLVTCFECGAELQVPASAESTMCRRCSHYVDLHDYRIANSLAKNFRTKGVFIIEPKGSVFNSESIVGDAVIRGKFHGKLNVENSLTVYSTADIKGDLSAGRLIVPAESHFHWAKPLGVGSADISGELAASVLVQDTITLRATARLFGNLDARNLVVEEGAVMVGKLRISPRTRNEQSQLL